MAFMSFSKKTISVAELQRQLEHPKYETIWRLMHKILSAMGKRDTFYQLEGEVELIFDDETIVAKAGDTITVPPNVWHAASCKEGGKMLSIFKNGQFDLYLEKLSKMADSDFEDAELMAKVNAEFDIYEGEKS